MKSPREILLQHHRAATPALDRIRQDVLAGELGAHATTPRLENTDARDDARGFALKLWRELIWPCRQVWAALAAVWLVLGVFELATRSQPPVEVDEHLHDKRYAADKDRHGEGPDLRLLRDDGREIGEGAHGRRNSELPSHAGIGSGRIRSADA